VGSVRLVAPGRRGFWWVKWVARLDVVDEPWRLQHFVPAPRKHPQQGGVGLLGHADRAAVGGDEGGLEKVVAGEPAAGHQPAEPA
jgi:DMSO/TMAO reductase YedYZ molybdopterin-dependent catalytic subunit